MRRSTLNRIGIVLLGTAFCLPAIADTQFRARRMTRNDVPIGRGQCDIRLQVDNEVEVTVRGDNVLIHNIAGRDAYDDGNTECNAPLPDYPPAHFNFEVKEQRGEIRLVQEPSRRNGFGAVVLIRDSAGGQGRYHFRLSWDMRVAELRGDDRRPGPPGFSWNNTLSFRGVGRGVATMNGFEQRLEDVNIEIDRGGRVIVTFRGPRRGRDLLFTGNLVGREEGHLRADVASEDGRMRGPMQISVGERENVNSISFQGGDGRDHMRLTWDRK